MYPEADVFTLMYDEEKVGKVFPKAKIHCTGPAQWLYKLTKKPRASLPLMTFSVSSLDLLEYDVIISSSSGFAHGVKTKHKAQSTNHKEGRNDNHTPVSINHQRSTINSHAIHVCYCHSPARYLWDWTDEIQAELGITKAQSTNHKAQIKYLFKIYIL